MAIRYPRGTEKLIPGGHLTECRKSQVLRDGKDVVIFSVGPMAAYAIAAAEILEKEDGITCAVVDIRRVKPLDTQTLLTAVSSKKLVLTCEDGVLSGGFACRLSELLLRNACHAGFRSIGIGDHPVPAGTIEELHDKERIDTKAIVETIRDFFGHS